MTNDIMYPAENWSLLPVLNFGVSDHKCWECNENENTKSLD